MQQKELIIRYSEYPSVDELPEKDRELASRAINAIRLSYSPYSSFQVGAAVRMSGGGIVEGANQENAAYPSGLCAERTALYSSKASFPEDTVESIALAGGPGGELTEEPVTPCGACRQVLTEFQKRAGHPISIIMIGRSRILKFDNVMDIIPFMFDDI